MEKKRKWRSLSVLLAFITLVSVISSTYFAYRNVDLQQQYGNLQNSLYNFSPFIFSNYSIDSRLNNMFFDPFSSELFLLGFINVDLKVVSPYDGMLTINVKSLNTYVNSIVPTFLNVSILNYSTVSFFPFPETQYQYFISKNVINQIEDKLEVKAVVYLNSGILQQAFQNDTTSVGFPLGDIIFQAKLFEVQTNQTYTKDFNQGVYCNIKTNP